MSNNKKKVAFISSLLVVCIVLAGLIFLTPTAKKYTTNVTIEVIKIEMLEDVNLDGKTTKGAFTIASSRAVNHSIQEAGL
ncbi:hypothetical protein ACFLRB_01135 [Acidobacteriota bacterium]